MRTAELFHLLKQHSDKPLLFEYAPNMLVAANYHITEVKNVKIEAVDCGAGADSWNETLIQLWESPKEVGKTRFMKASKALAILERVGQMKSYDMEAEVKIEYGNAQFHTTQLRITGFSITKGNLLLKLAVNPTVCKAKETCGRPQPETVDAGCCAPGSGCC